MEGIITEIKEELGINVEKNILTLFKTIKTKNNFVELYYIKQDINLNSIIMQIEEVDNVQWFSMDEITKLINNNKFLPPYIEFYYDCLKYLN